MEMELARPGLRRGMRVKPILRQLGLLPSARWEEARAAMKRRVVAARVRGDEAAAAEASEVLAFLKRNMRRSCSGCGVALKGRTCMTCDELRRAARPARRRKKLVHGQV